MAYYTIKGLAKANECESHDATGLANLWDYWLACNNNDRQCVNDFLRLKKAERDWMLGFLYWNKYEKLRLHILNALIADKKIKPLPF